MKRVHVLGALALVAVLTLGACSFLQCRFKERVVDAFSEGTANFLECSGKAAVRRDISEIVSKFGICSTETGPIADALCAPLVASIVEVVADKPIPKDWACKATKAKAEVTNFLVDLCKKIPVN